MNKRRAVLIAVVAVVGFAAAVRAYDSRGRFYILFGGFGP